MLYTLRTFAHYRRTFYVGLVASSGYLGLLNQLQNIRNQEQIVKAFARNNLQYEAEFKAGLKSVIELQQVAFQYQSSQVTLLGQEANLQTALRHLQGLARPAARAGGASRRYGPPAIPAQ